MAGHSAQFRTAGQREAGTLCPRCGGEILLGTPTAVCQDCGAPHHEACWHAGAGCEAYECAQSGAAASAAVPAMSISRDDLAAAEPLPSRTSFEGSADGADSGPVRKRWNRTGVWAFIISLVGIPLFGLVTGLVAIVVACVALAGHTRGRRGIGLAVLAVVIGLFEVIGWAIGLSHFLGVNQGFVALDNFAFDPASLDELPERISRAMRANVMIQSSAGFGRQGIGSGVILKTLDGAAYIVTNRHVVDHNYTDATDSVPDDLDALDDIEVMTVERTRVPGRVEWIAPHGVDLAIVSAPMLSDDAQEAYWDRDAPPRIGDSVFAVGNPHGLGWTFSEGDISQVRRQMRGSYRLRLLQTTAAINAGNSGGGLYDAQGRLIGINTLTGDKRVAEGLGFSIALSSLLDLVPERMDLSPKNPAENVESNPESSPKASPE